MPRWSWGCVYGRFNPRSPRGGATLGKEMALAQNGTFQSTLPTRGSDAPLLILRSVLSGFNPRSPRGGATIYHSLPHRKEGSFNPRSPRGGATICSECGEEHEWVSIHAPHEGERRDRRFFKPLPVLCFNPRSPRGGATVALINHEIDGNGFNPRSPRGGATRMGSANTERVIWVSIHAPHEGERPSPVDAYCSIDMFQSTLPTRGSDLAALVLGVRVWAFQSTLPTRGSDQIISENVFYDLMFQSTLPTRGSDILVTKGLGATMHVSIHAPHEGERQGGGENSYKICPLFQSTLPTRGSDGGKVHLYAAFPRIY